MSLALATAAGPNAFAADPGVVATAPASGTGAPSSAPAHDGTADQIDAWIAPDSAHDSASPPPEADARAPRTIHGEVGAGVGTGDYRNVYGVADIPVGRTGDLIVAASSSSGQVRGGRYGVGGDALALGFYPNGAPATAPGCGRRPWGQPAPAPAYATPGQINCGAAPAP
jgi:hypothetical protein